MFGKVLSVAVLAAVFGATAVAARGLDGPAELPPAGYKGQQYVDSRGCVFLRAGYGGQVTWVPRVSADRKQLCGYPPSGGTVAVAEAAPAAPSVTETAEVVVKPAAVETKPAAVVVAAAPKTPSPAPAPTVVSSAPEAVRPATPTELAATETGATAEGGAGYRLACPADTPVAERFEIRGSTGTKVMCTRGDGSLDGANFPVLVAGSLAGQPVGYDAYLAAGNGGKTGAAPGGTVYTVPAGASKSTKSAKYPDAVPPKGYKLAWKDDRLNPNRGKQTLDGFLAMDEIWTTTTPAELREDSTAKRKPVKIIVRRADGTEVAHEGYVLSSKGGERKVVITSPAAAEVSKSTMAVAPEAVKKPAKAVAEGKRFLVQVGTFGVKSNAEGAAGKLKGKGLPVARGKARGGALTVVYAGPFASSREAKAALSAARSLGFSDAVIVQ